MAEFREIGHDKFVRRYGFGRRRVYSVFDGAFLYDAKALLGAAFGYQYPERGPLPHTEFSGGEAGANKVLRDLGFEVVDVRKWQPEQESSLRQAKWAEVGSLKASGRLTPATIRQLEIYGGAQGVWVDKEARTGVIRPNGVAVGILLTGRHYPDDADNAGVLYHYPKTRRPPSRDAGEIAALKNAQDLNLPVFVISPASTDHSLREVRLGWVVGHDDPSAQFLITFSPAQLEAVREAGDEPAEFIALASRRRRRRTSQQADRDPIFKFNALRRYQGVCPLTQCSVPEMLDAAHVIPVEDDGTDDPRNALLLEAGIHRAFDAGLWAIHPETLAVVTRPGGPSPDQMGIRVSNLKHVRWPPHRDALQHRYEAFARRAGLQF